jgi:hypothetical protein
MGATYTRQSSAGIVDGGVIEASDLNDEFDQLLAAFAVSTGHSHDGTAAEGGPITKLLGTSMTIGDGTAGTDITLTFDGETSDGVMYWMEDEDHFKFADDVVMDSSKRLYLYDEGGEYIYGDGTDLYLTSGADINIPSSIGLTFGDDGEKIEGDGTNLTISTSNNVTVDAAADIILDAGGADVTLKDDGTTFGSLTQSGGELLIKSGSTPTTAATFSGANVTLAGTVGSGAITSTGTIQGTTITATSAFAGTLSTAAQANVTSLGTLTALTVDDVAIDGKVVTMTGSSSDTAVLTAGTNGTLSIVTTDAAAAAANIQITADGTVDVDSAGVLTLDSGAAINIEPASGSAILLDGTISIDAGVVTGATSITSTAFVGDITGDVTGNTSGSAATVTTAAQTNITSLGTLTALTVDDVALNGKVVTMTGSASDTAVFTAGTNGTLSIVTTDAAAAAANIQITADGTVDIDSAGVLTLDSGAAINIEPASGSAILLDGTISVDAGVVTGATSITSTAFVGTLSTAAQANVTSLGTLTTLTVDNVIVNGTTIGHTSDTDLLTLADAAVTALGTITVGVDDTGHDVKFFGASAGAYMEWDESADQLRIMGASADATTSTGKLLLATSLTDINANDVIGKIDFQAPHEAGGTDAITVAASIQAIAQATFSGSVNATDLIFYTGHSEAAAEKVRFTSQNEIGIAGANYGTDGQVLTSGGAGAAVAWEDASAGTVTAINNQAESRLVSLGSTTTQLDGEANLTFTGSALTCIGTVTVGVDNTGHDVKFFGATASSYALWDESEDSLVLNAATLDLNGTADGLILDANGNTTISSPTDDQIDIEIAGADDFTFTANTFTALSGSTVAIAAGGAITNAGTMAPDITSTGKAMVMGL